MPSILRLSTKFFCFALILGITGCDQVRQKVADTLAPPSPVEMVARMDSLTDNNKATEAVEQGKAYLERNKDPQNLVKQALSRAYIASGIANPQVNSDPAMQKVPSVAGGDGAPLRQAEQPQMNGVAVDGASVTSGPNGTVVRAGNAVVVMPR